MLAFHNDPAIKAYYLARVHAHRAADEIRHGYYWESGKGCAVGCTIHGGTHSAYEQELGIPRLLARLEDGIFEALDPPHDLAWPERFLEAVPVGADLAMVWPQFALALLADDQHGVLRHVDATKHHKQHKVMQKIIIYYQQWVSTQEKPAYAAAADAADAADADAAAAAADADADAAAKQEARIWQSETLLRLLAGAPVIQEDVSHA